MKRIFKDSTTEIYTNAAGDTAGIIKDSGAGNCYFVTIRRAGEKGKTIKTHCNYDTASFVVENFLG